MSDAWNRLHYYQHVNDDSPVTFNVDEYGESRQFDDDLETILAEHRQLQSRVAELDRVEQLKSLEQIELEKAAKAVLADHDAAADELALAFKQDRQTVPVYEALRAALTASEGSEKANDQ